MDGQVDRWKKGTRDNREKIMDIERERETEGGREEDR